MPFVPSRRSLQSAPQISPALPECVRQRRVCLLVQDDAARIGEDQRVTGLGDVVVQPVDLRRSDLHQVRGLFAAAPPAKRRRGRTARSDAPGRWNSRGRSGATTPRSRGSGRQPVPPAAPPGRSRTRARSPHVARHWNPSGAPCPNGWRIRLGGMYHPVTVSLNQCQGEYTRPTTESPACGQAHALRRVLAAQRVGKFLLA